MSKRKIILFELNEVPWRVMKDYCQKYPDTFLAQNLKKCFKYETVTPDHGHLSPWITWPTLHRGVDNSKHHIKDFNQDLTEANTNYPAIWEILHKNGIRTGVCGSMHSSPPPSDFRSYSFYIPDPFAPTKDAHPKVIEAFQDFNLKMSRESARNVSGGLNVGAATKVLTASPRLGLKASTFMEIGRHVIDERRRPWVRTRRRTYQMVLAFDVFKKQLKNTKPEFATFFTNHVASSMHRYWAATYPGDYQKFNIEKSWVDTYKGEIYFTMGVFNRFFKSLAEFTQKNPEYILVIASSMGQASTTAEQLDSQVYMEHHENFFKKLGLTPQDYRVVPCMFPQFNVIVNPDKAELFKSAISKLRINNEAVEYREAENGFFSIELGHPNCKNESVSLNGMVLPFSEMGLHNLMIDDKSGSTAYHIPEGTCLVYDPQRDAATEEIVQVPSTALAPNFLKNFNVALPSYMNYIPMKGITA